MSELTYRHTARVKADSWFIRFYVWLWEADVSQIDFCRLFWGYVFAVPNLLLRALGYIPLKLARALKASGPAERMQLTWAEEAQIRARSEQRRARRNARFNRFFSRVGSAVDRVVATAKAAWPVLKYPVYAAGSIALAAAACALAVGAYYLALLVIANLDSVLHVLLVALAVSAVLSVGFAVVTGVVWFFLDTRYGRSVRTGVKDGFLTFGGVVRTGFFGIKSRTCPKIELVGASEGTTS